MSSFLSRLAEVVSEEAERLYRSIVGSYPDDVEAWFQLAEVLSHYTPLRGRPFTGARAPFEKVLQYEPDHTSALWHLSRIAARERRMTETDSLIARVVALAPEGDRILELIALQAVLHGDSTGEDRVLASLERAIDMTRYMTVWNLAHVLADHGAALRSADLLKEPTRSPAVRALGYLVAANLSLARGRAHDARVLMDSVEIFDPGAAIAYRALQALLPFAGGSLQRLLESRADLERWRPPDEPPPDARIPMMTPMGPLPAHVHQMLLGLVHARLGEEATALRFAAALDA